MALGSTCAFNPIGFCFGSILPQPQEWPKLFGRLVLHVGRQGACKLASGWGQFSGKTPSYPFLNSTFKKRLLIAIDRLPTDFLSFFYLSLFCEAQPFTPTKAQDVTCIHQEDQALMERGVYGLGGFLARSKKLLILWSQPYLGQLWSSFTGCWSAFAAEHAAVFQAFGTQTIDPVIFFVWMLRTVFWQGQRPNIAHLRLSSNLTWERVA